MKAREKFKEEVKPDNVDCDGVQVSSTLSADGRFEYPDPVPMAPPVGYVPEPNIVELIRMYVRRELSQSAAQEEFDTFEEADDFEIDDDPMDPLTPYERVFEPKPKPSEVPVPAASPELAKSEEVVEAKAEGGPQPTGAPPTPPTSKPNSTLT